MRAEIAVMTYITSRDKKVMITALESGGE